MKKLTIFYVFVLICTLLAMAVSVNADEEILEVGPGKPYATIQAAVDAAGKGSQILVYADWYNESVSVTKNNLKIIAQEEGVIVEPPDIAGFLVQADRVTVQGFEIHGGINCANSVRLEGRRNTIAQNRFLVSNSSNCIDPLGFLIFDHDGGSDFNTIEGNYVVAGQGIQIVANDPGTKNKGNVIKNNEIYSELFAINVYDGEGFTISGNWMTAVYQSCITAYAGEGMHVGHHLIQNNTLVNCAYLQPFGVGIGLYAEDNASMTNNQVISNTISLTTVSGIILSTSPWAEDKNGTVSHNVIEDNLVFHNIYDGITLAAGADHNQVINNESQTNDGVGVSVSGDKNFIIGNTIWNNTTNILDEGVGNKWRNNNIFNQ